MSSTFSWAFSQEIQAATPKSSACQLNYVLWNLCARILHITGTQTFPECERRLSWAYLFPLKGQSHVQEQFRIQSFRSAEIPNLSRLGKDFWLLWFRRFNGQVIATHGFLLLFLEDDKRYGRQRRPASSAYQFEWIYVFGSWIHGVVPSFHDSDPWSGALDSGGIGMNVQWQKNWRMGRQQPPFAEARLIGHIHRNFALLGKAIEGSNRDLC